MYDGAMAFVLDDHGYLRDPNLHDGLVDGIHLPSDTAVTVSLRDIQGQRFSMQLIGAVAFVCDDFRLGNIILDVQIASRVTPDMDTLGSLFGTPHPSAAEGHARALERYAEKIREGTLALVTINPSYGCTLTALCREVLISRASTPLAL